MCYYADIAVHSYAESLVTNKMLLDAQGLHQPSLISDADFRQVRLSAITQL